MTTTFRIDELRLDTVNGPVVHRFAADLTVLAGQTGVGKTTILELIKFALGGDGLIAPVIRESVSDIHLSIRAGSSHMQFSRAVDVESRRHIRIIDLVTGDRLPDHSVGGDAPKISDLLMESLGLPVGLKAAARGGRSASAGNQITFNDVFKFMYVPQSEMNRDIAKSHDGYYDPKRKAVFELLFGITDADILQMRSEVNLLKGQVDSAKRDVVTVHQFLADSGITSRIDAIQLSEAADRDEQSAKEAIRQFQGELGEAIDVKTQTLRDLLGNAERSVAEASQLAVDLRREQNEYRSERRRVQIDAARLTRMASAGERLANIEFTICPRCTQPLTGRQVPDGQCRVCLQGDIVDHLPLGQLYETEQLKTQLEEIDSQLEVIAVEARQADLAVKNRQELVRSLTSEIDQRTSDRVTPRLQAYADAVTKAERARGSRTTLEHILQQWDRADDLSQTAEALTRKRDTLRSQLRNAEAQLLGRKTTLIADLSAEFQSTVTAFGIPSIQTAAISEETYLPLLNGQPFEEASSGGGIITATQVAYWLALITVAARQRDTLFPGFLILDSPRLALNVGEALPAQMYRRFVTQVSVTPGRLQFIVADNELLKEYARQFTELTFTYEQPTVSSVEHPGPARVQTIDDQGNS